VDRRDGLLVTVRPTLDTSIYASGDVLFAATKVPEVAQDTKGMAYLRTLVACDLSNQKQAIDLLFFNQDPGSIGGLNNAVTLSTAQLLTLIGVISLGTTDWTTGQSGTNAYAQKLQEMLIPCAKSLKDIWVAGVVRSGTPTYGASSLILNIALERL
jgi:hypothetical protein